MTDYPVRIRPNYPPPPHPHPRSVGCIFLRLITHMAFCHPSVCFFEKFQRSETSGKFQLTSAIVRTHYEFPLVFHAANTTLKTMCCGVAAISDSAAYMTGYVASTDTPKNSITTKNMQASKMDQHCPQSVLWLNVGDFRWSSLLGTCSIGSTQRTKEIRHV